MNKEVSNTNEACQNCAVTRSSYSQQETQKQIIKKVKVRQLIGLIAPIVKLTEPGADANQSPDNVYSKH